MTPPIVPDNRTVHAQSIAEVGEFDENKFKNVKLTPEDEAAYADWTFNNDEWVQQELAIALKKQDDPLNEIAAKQDTGGCCVVL